MSVARALSLALLVALPSAARADAPRPLRHDLKVDVAITATASALLLATELGKQRIAPTECRLCGTNGLDDGVRGALVWSHPERAKVTSDVLAVAVLPAAAIGSTFLAARAAGDGREGLLDALFIVEAVALAADVNQLVKLTAGRERPFVRFGDPAAPGRSRDPDDLLSFYSGHSSIAFSVVAATGSVASLRGYRTAPWIYAVGFPLAASVAYFRMAGDMHYLSDVLTGAVIGTAVGLVAPRLLHPRERDGATTGARLAIVPFPIGVQLAF
jgi:membrane-associated phospholipid phosphatase